MAKHIVTLIALLISGMASFAQMSLTPKELNMLDDEISRKHIYDNSK